MGAFLMMNLPNSITLLRILCVIILTIALQIAPLGQTLSTDSIGSEGLTASTARIIAFWAFVIGAISDFFDGYLARRMNLVTNFGKLIDPLADKILVCTAFIYLSVVGLCPYWITVVIVTREFLVTGIRQLAAAQGYVMAADKSGKWKTGFQLAFCIDGLMLVAYGAHLPEPFPTLLFDTIGFWLRNSLLWLSLLLTLWSGVHYCIQGSKFIRG